jgi:hypothetical protein
MKHKQCRKARWLETSPSSLYKILCKLFVEMLSELENDNTLLFLELYSNEASERMWVLDKYLVEGRKVRGILGQ